MMALDEKRLESLAIEWIIRQVRDRRRMKDTLPIEGAMTVPLEWAESLANAYAPMATDDTRPAYDDLAAVVRSVAASDPQQGDSEGWLRCRYCDGWLDGDEGHADDCAFVRCRALAARLPPD